jgi:hypothetical protein
MLNLSSNSRSTEERTEGAEEEMEDEFTLMVHGNREPDKMLKITLRVKIFEAPTLLKVL